MWAELKNPEYGGCERSIRSLKSLIWSAKANSTVKKYSLYWQKFTAWLKKRSFPVELPVAPMKVALYIADIAPTCTSASSVNAHVYGIKYAHTVCGAPDPTISSVVTLAVEGARRSGPKHKRKKSHFDLETVKKIVARYGREGASLRELRFVLMSVFAFLGLLRIGELLGLKTNDVVVEKDCIKLNITKSKTDQHADGREILIDITGAIDAGSILKRYITMAGLKTNSDFLFKNIFVRKQRAKLSAKNEPMTYTRARAELGFYVEGLGLDRTKFGWHSFRHGGATAASKEGVDHGLIKDHGRWKSDSAKMTYIHESTERLLSVSKRINI